MKKTSLYHNTYQYYGTKLVFRGATQFIIKVINISIITFSILSNLANITVCSRLSLLYSLSTQKCYSPSAFIRFHQPRTLYKKLRTATSFLQHFKIDIHILPYLYLFVKFLCIMIHKLLKFIGNRSFKQNIFFNSRIIYFQTISM